jgi:hypothetical protein
VKPWIETRKFWFTMNHAVEDEARGENWRLRRITPDRLSLDRWLDGLIDELNDGQWEIKAILPLDRGRTYQEIAPLPDPAEAKKARKAGDAAAPVIDAYGVGWGTSVVWSVCFIAQRTLWLSDDDYRRRVAERDGGDRKLERDRRREQARQQAAGLEAEIAPLRLEREKLAQAPIAFQKALFGKSGWQFKETRYASQAEAEAARAAALAELDTRIATLAERLPPLLD